jgi:GntR family transcriptional repressor for pyruvate dehydrogenase complex
VTEGTRFQQVQPVRLYQRIVEQIEDAIASGELKPGERLPSERELVAQFGASRPTVREALRVLESSGVVRSRPGDPNGPEILPFSPSGLAKQMTRLARVEQMSIADLVSFRMILDGSANMLAARLRSEDELAAIEKTIAVMETAIEEGYDRFSEADVAFHDAVALASRNALIQVCNNVVRGVVLSLISDKVTRARNSKALMRESLQHHKEVLQAIRAGDGPAAARISRQNLYDYYAGYVPKKDREPLLALLEGEQD